MTQLKKLKKAIRARSRKTGESYMTARRQVLLARQKRRSLTLPSAPRPAPSPALRATSLTKGAVGEAAVLKKTGHGFDHWFAALDAFGAAQKGHTATARHLYGDHGVPGWYAQGITVAYERARGLRAVNQACTGDFQVSVSKAVAASVAEVVAAFGNARQRGRWLVGADPGLAGALKAAFAGTKAKGVTLKDDGNARLRYPWDGTTVEIYITGKPKGGATVVAFNIKLADAAQVERRRGQWRVALEALKAHLAR